MRYALIYSMWALFVAAIVLPSIFRRSRALRLLGVVVLLGAAQLASTGVMTCARIATEKKHLSTGGPDQPFVQGAIAARDAALHLMPEFWVAVLGLAVLALVPVRPRT